MCSGRIGEDTKAPIPISTCQGPGPGTRQRKPALFSASPGGLQQVGNEAGEFCHQGDSPASWVLPCPVAPPTIETLRLLIASTMLRSCWSFLSKSPGTGKQTTAQEPQESRATHRTLSIIITIMIYKKVFSRQLC